MTREKIISEIKEKLGGKIKKFRDKSAGRVYIDIERKDLAASARFVFKDLGARFNTATAADHPDSIEIMYHFNFDRQALIVTLTVYAPKGDCAVDSLLPMMRGAEWIEREIHELFGVDFTGHPDIRPLLLPDDWPKDKHPLRKSCVLTDYNNEKAKRKKEGQI